MGKCIAEVAGKYIITFELKIYGMSHMSILKELLYMINLWRFILFMNYGKPLN